MVELSKARCLDYPKFVVSALLLVFSTVCTFYAIIGTDDVMAETPEKAAKVLHN